MARLKVLGKFFFLCGTNGVSLAENVLKMYFRV